MKREAEIKKLTKKQKEKLFFQSGWRAGNDGGGENKSLGFETLEDGPVDTFVGEISGVGKKEEKKAD